MKPKYGLIGLLWVLAWPALAQEVAGYQVPPAPILELADAQPLPGMLSDSQNRVLVLLRRNAYKSLGEVSARELRLAGLSIDVANQVTHSSLDSLNARTNLEWASGLSLRLLQEQGIREVTGLPANPRLAHFVWSPDESMLAFTHASGNGLEVWVLQVASGEAMRVGSIKVNGVLGNPLLWFKDGTALLVRAPPQPSPLLLDPEQSLPAGPLVSVSDGNKSQMRTYQNLLETPLDDANFEALAVSELWRVSLDGEARRWAGPAMYQRIAFSPDGRHLLAESVRRPFSRLAPVDRFPLRVELLDQQGKTRHVVAEVAASDRLPQGRMAVREGKRQFAWRADQPATLVWTQALDGGDPARKVAYRDAVFAWPAPFTQAPQLLLKTINRHERTLWGDDEHAIAIDTWWNNRNTKSYLFKPGHPGHAPLLLASRDFQARYADPGVYQMQRNAAGEQVLLLDGGHAYQMGEGHSAEGQFPFLDRVQLSTGSRQRLYQSRLQGEAESLFGFVGKDRDQLLVTVESPDKVPDYFVRSLNADTPPQRLTRFENPYASLQGVSKQVIKYARDDGLELSGTLYLPPGHVVGQDARLPLVIWAYPTEYKDRQSAGEVAANPWRFMVPDYKSPIYWALRGYAVLDKASFPIVGEGDAQPNDSYLKQLLGNAKAAIDAVEALGVADRKRVVVGGHSYGAFMIANLLTHSDYFVAGIARSGAYNRTLTPFGFQREERTYWEAPEVYNAMSPFLAANLMKTPLLLIHGGADSNAGTHTMQSERYFAALKSLGAPARLVLLPNEGHAYQARESVLHTLWEQDQWLQRYANAEERVQRNEK